MLTGFVRSRRRVGVGIGCAAAIMLSGVVFTIPATSAAPAAVEQADAGDEFTTVADTLVSITPARFVDTRPGAVTIDGQFAGTGKRAADSEFAITIAGRDAVPADAAGVVVNVTAVAPDDRGYVTLHPCASPRPVISSLNYVAGINTGNEVIAALTTDGSLCAYVLSSTHITIDVVAYVPKGSEISPIVPARLLETRPGRTTVDGLANNVGRTSPGSSVTVQVTGRGGVPATGVESVFVNVTAVDARERGYVTVHACLQEVPSTSSLNHVPGVNRGNELLVELSADGEICLFTSRSIHLTVDIVSYIETDSTVSTITPFRLADSRPGGFTDDDDDSGFGPQSGGSEYRLQVAGRADVPADAAAAVVNLTAVAPTARGFFTVHPCVTPRPLASSLNYTARVNGANEIIAGLSADGELCIFTNTTAHFAVDIVGYLQAVEPIAQPDTFGTIGNVLLEVGVAPGAFPAVVVAGDVLANDDASKGLLTVSGFDVASELGGTIAMDTDGTFSYTPPAGVSGVTDTFSYEVAVDGVPTDSGTVSIAIDDMVWFVDNTSSAAAKTGTSNAPFDRLAAAGAASSAGDTIFVYAGDSTDTGYDEGVTLAAGQSLIGEASGLTIGTNALVPPGATPKLSASGGANTVTAGDDATLTGLSLSISGSGAAIRFTGAGAAVVDVDVSANSDGVFLDGATGAFTFTDVDIASSGGPSFRVDGGSSSIMFTSSSITQTGSGAAIDISAHTGSFTLPASSTVNATGGTGLQFDNADGTYQLSGAVTLNGGDAGIDILGGSAGTFTFPATTTITNPTGPAVNITDLAAGATVDYPGSIVANLDVILNIDTTGAGSAVNFIKTGGNTLTSTGNPNGAIFLFDVDGDLTMTTPTTVTAPEFSTLFATDGDGDWAFTDLTITDQKGLNGGVDLFGNQGTVTFTNVNITTDSAGTGDAPTGFLAGGNNVINVNGSSSVDADGGGALVLINVATVDMTFQSLTSTNNLDSQIGFAGDDGIDILNVNAGTIDVIGTTTVTNADGVAISVEDTGAALTFADIALDGIGQDGVISGVAFDSAGSLTINGGTINNVGQDGVRIGSNSGSGAADFEINDVTFTSIGANVAEVGNSGLAGSGNVAAVFSCNDLGGNTGSISFNAGADTCP